MKRLIITLQVPLLVEALGNLLAEVATRHLPAVLTTPKQIIIMSLNTLTILSKTALLVKKLGLKIRRRNSIRLKKVMQTALKMVPLHIQVYQCCMAHILNLNMFSILTKLIISYAIWLQPNYLNTLPL